MGNFESAEDRFLQQLRGERQRRKWSQAHIATLLNNKGIQLHPTAIAKIETGERAARIDELAAIADIFEVSMDVLLGRSVAAEHDETYLLRALLDEAQQALIQISTVRTALRGRIHDVAALGSDGIGSSIASGCEHAADALTEAHSRLYETLNPPGSGAVAKFTRKLLIDALQKEES